MALVAAVALVGVFVDSRVLAGAPIWLKPFKFAVSLSVYGLTLAWMLSLLPRRSRAAERAATVIVAMSAVEMVVIVGQVVRGRTSHFNATTPLDNALWQAMGAAILTLWLAHLVIAVVLIRRPLIDRAATYGVRLGLGIAWLGMLAAVPMVLPGAAPDTPGITGAHSVGVADGSRGTPVTGWNLDGGDLRIGHFVGLHGLQALPLLALGLSLLAGRSPRARARLDERTRVRLLVVSAGAYAVLTAMLTWQALRGQPLLRPDALTLGAFAALAVATVTATVAVLRAGVPADQAAATDRPPATVLR
jgi:hypothetical protein